jgi:hypothetical protein
MKLTNEQKAKLFDAMLADGVDNWEGYQGETYQEVMADIEAEEKLEETMKKLEPLYEIIALNSSADYPSVREAGMSIQLTEDGEKEVALWIIKNFN